MLLNDEDSENQNDITEKENTLINTSEYQNEYALIVGSYNQKVNAKNLELEMKKGDLKTVQ